MIQVFLDNHEVFPASGKSIKMTKENPSLTEKGTYSLDIELPLDIATNILFFGPLCRSEVSKDSVKFDCVIKNDGSTIQSGNATIIKVTDTAVTVQLTEGRISELPSGIADKYIDEVYIGEIYYAAWYGAQTEFRFYHRLTVPYQSYNGRSQGAQLRQGEIIPPPPDKTFLYMSFNDSQAHKVIDGKYYWKATGMTENGKYFASTNRNFVFVPAYNDTASLLKNDIFWWQTEPDTDSFELYQIPEVPQPRLFYILEKLFFQLGYEVDFSDYSDSIYKDIYIANARSTRYPNYMLPHWTVKELLDEMKLFLRCDVRTDAVNKTIIFKKQLQGTADISEIEIVDSFSAEIDSDKAGEIESKFIVASNIGYDLSDAHDYDKADRILLALYERQPYSVIFTEDWQTWSEEKKAKYLYVDTDGTMSCYNKDTQRVVYINQFRDIIVNETEDVKQMKISPVALQMFDFNVLNDYVTKENGSPEGWNHYKNIECALETVRLKLTDTRNSGTEITNDLWADINTPIPEKSDPEDRLQVFFFNGMQPAGPVQYGWETINVVIDGQGAVHYQPSGPLYHMTVAPVGWTDNTYKLIKYTQLPYSFRIYEGGSPAIKTVATYGESTQLSMDFRTQHTFQFLASTPPDVSQVFLIRGKKYLCENVEYDITDDGIDPLMTGYFYEITE